MGRANLERHITGGIAAPMVGAPRVIGATRSGKPIYSVSGGMGATQAAMRQAPPRGGRGGQQAPPAPVIPFVRASHQFVEGPFVDQSRTLGTGLQALGPFEVPSRGYLRHVYLQVEVSGGTGGTGSEDAPWNLINSLSLQDVNGTPIVNVGPGAGGYHLYLMNLFGGYAFESDPAAMPGHNGTSPNYVFTLRVPVEVTERDGFGAIVNQNAAASYKLYMTLNNIASVWSSAPTGTMTIRVRGWVEGWTQPNPTDLLGQPQAVEPPGHGTTQFVSEQIFSQASGRDQIRFTRLGNLIRSLILVCRTAGARSTTNFPDPLEMYWDSRQVLNISRNHLRQLMYERFGRTPPTGVFVLSYMHDDDGHGGNETRHLYLPTVQPTRLEVAGVYGAASVVSVITNDIAPVAAPVRPTG